MRKDRFSVADEAIDIGSLLEAHESGDPAALDRLVAILYEELRRLAKKQLRYAPGGAHTLNTTGLVHEAYLKLAGSPGLHLNDRAHLMALTARAMRQVLVSRARARLRKKRDFRAESFDLDTAVCSTEPDAGALLDLDRAIGRLRQRSEELASVFECRYFGGLSEEETADALGLSLRSAQRAWMRARAWLRADLEGLETPPEP